MALAKASSMTYLTTIHLEIILKILERNEPRVLHARRLGNTDSVVNAFEG